MPAPAAQNFLEMARKGVPVDDETYNALQAATRQSVPTGEEGDTRSEIQRFSDAFDQPDPRDRLNRSLLRYGDQVIIPPVEEIPGALLDATNDAGNVMMAYPQSFGPAGPVMEAVGMALKAPRALFPASKVAEKAVSPGEAALAAEGERTARSVASRNAAKAARRDAAYAEAHPELGPTVPKIDGYTPMKERNAVLDFLQSNPYVQPIKGRRGMPTKQEQIDLANQFFERGGRLAEPGPWGRDMPESVRGVLRGESSKARGSTGPRQNSPGYADMLDTIRKANDTIKDLTQRLKTARSSEIPSLRQAIDAQRRRADQYMMWFNEGSSIPRKIDVPNRAPPRIYRNDK